MSEPRVVFETDETRNHPMFLDVTRMISFHRESGRLEITAGTTRGSFFFHDGKLVYAHLGCLTGFQAVNAAVSMADAHFSFDPGISPLTSGTLTVTERIILKKFFSIETANPQACAHPTTETEIDWDSTPAPVVPLTDAEVSELSVNEAGNNAASVLGFEAKTSSIDRQISRFEERAEPGIPEPETPALSAIQSAPALQYSEDEIGDANKHGFVRPKPASSKPWKTGPYQVVLTLRQYRARLAFAIVLALMAGGAVALVKKLSDLRLATQVAKQNVTTETLPNNPSAAPSPQPSLVKQIALSKVAQPEPVQDKQSEPVIAKQSSDSLPDLKKRKMKIDQGDATSPNLTGTWKVTNVVQKTSYRSFEHLEVGFQLAVNQTGRQFTAEGQKVSENGRVLPISRRTPIHVTGSIDGDRIEATFFEQGVMRKTNGRFVWKIHNGGAGLSGMFVSTAAKSSGKSAATKVL
jgi:hypothetical protein